MSYKKKIKTNDKDLHACIRKLKNVSIVYYSKIKDDVDIWGFTN